MSGIHLKREKCKFAFPEIELLGFRVNREVIQQSFDKVKTIHEAPTAKDKTELQPFLGMLNFYGCFLKKQIRCFRTIASVTPKRQRLTLGG